MPLEENTLHLGDCMDLLKQLPAMSVDCIVTDPPYYFPDSHYKPAMSSTQVKRTIADLGLVEYFFRDCITQMCRVVKPKGAIYMFCDGESYPLFWYHLYPLVHKIQLLTWDKGKAALGQRWRRQCELIIFAPMSPASSEEMKKGTPDGDILRQNIVSPHHREHPTEKPVPLLEKLILKSTGSGDLVLDPFSGSGSTLVAAKKTGRRFLGFEKSKEYYEMAKFRIEQPTDAALFEGGENDE